MILIIHVIRAIHAYDTINKKNAAEMGIPLIILAFAITIND